MRPEGHARYDFDEEHVWLLLQDGRQKYNSDNKALQCKKRRTGAILLLDDAIKSRDVALIEMLDADWLCGKAEKEAIAIKDATLT